MSCGSEILEPGESGLTQRVVSNGNFAAICYEDYTTVLPTDTISSGGNYVDEDITVLGGYQGRKVVFTVNGTSYAVYEGTVWGAFLGGGGIDCPICGDNGYVSSNLLCEDCFAEFILVDESDNEVSVYSGIEEGNYFLKSNEVTFTVNGDEYSMPTGSLWYEFNIAYGCPFCGALGGGFSACNDCLTVLTWTSSSGERINGDQEIENGDYFVE